MLLAADFHLDDTVANEYRWRVFDALIRVGRREEQLFILGDMFDRRDRHSARFVNRVHDELRRLRQHFASITILQGNHDGIVNGVSFWQFYDRYVTEPVIYPTTGLCLLPYAAAPQQAWQHIDFSAAKAIFMHQPISGARLENGTLMQIKEELPRLPRIPIFSGDIHIPQSVCGVMYVGAPHPINFGDNYTCRVLRLHDTSFRVLEEIPIPSIQKLIVAVSSLEALATAPGRPGDQVCIRYALDEDEVERWPAIKAAIHAWAEERGASLAAIEPSTQWHGPPRPPDGGAGQSIGETPEQVLRAFCAAQGLESALLQAGLELLTTN